MGSSNPHLDYPMTAAENYQLPVFQALKTKDLEGSNMIQRKVKGEEGAQGGNIS